MSSTERKTGQQYSAIVSRAIEVERGTKDCAASRLVPESPIWQLVCLVKGSHTAKPGWGPVKTDGQRSQLSGVTVGRSTGLLVTRPSIVACGRYGITKRLLQPLSGRGVPPQLRRNLLSSNLAAPARACCHHFVFTRSCSTVAYRMGGD